MPTARLCLINGLRTSCREIHRTQVTTASGSLGCCCRNILLQGSRFTSHPSPFSVALCSSSYIFRRWSFNCHGHQVFSAQQHETKDSFLFPLWLFGIFRSSEKRNKTLQDREKTKHLDQCWSSSLQQRLRPAPERRPPHSAPFPSPRAEPGRTLILSAGSPPRCSAVTGAVPASRKGPFRRLEETETKRAVNPGSSGT